MAAAVIKEFPLEEEYKKKTGVTPNDIKKLREWLGTQPHLPGEHITDLDLILTYHCCECSPEVAKQVLDLNFTLKTLFVNFFKDRCFDKRLELAMRTVLLWPLPMKTKDDYTVLFARLVDYDAKNFVFADAVRVALMVVDLYQYEQGTWPGFIIVIDMEGVTLSHIAKLDLHSLQQFFYFLQEALLVKLKGLHFLNAPSFMDKVLMLIKPFMKKQLLDLLHIHQCGSKTLEQWVPMVSLPKDSGGEAISKAEARDLLIEKFRANNQYFIDENKKRVTESKRPGKPKTITDIFGGIEGSFKKLDID